MIGLMRAESLKIRSTRTTLGLLAGMTALVVLVVVLTGVFAKSSDLIGTSNQLSLLSYGSFAIVFAGLAGVLLVTSEYRYGTIRPTLLFNPSRARVLIAKLVASFLAGIIFSVVAEGAGLIAGLLILTARGLPLTLSGGDIGLLIGGTIAGTALWAALGVGLGSLIRNQVGALIVLLSWIFVVEPLVFAFVPSVGRWFPGQAVNALTGLASAHLLAPAAAAAVLVLWASSLAVAGNALMARTDVS